jgi:hypothetical protein
MLPIEPDVYFVESREVESSPVPFERREDVRLIVSMPGKYSFASRRDKKGNRREFACRLVNVSSRAVALAVPVIGPVGERVIVYVDKFGNIEGEIIRVLSAGFVVGIRASTEDREKFVSKISWLSRYVNQDVIDSRDHGRIVPRIPNSTLLLADGSVLSCFVIDMSISGAAVSADAMPAIGTPLAVGRIVGKVVRHFAEGFAIKFVQEQSAEALEPLLIKR